MPRKARSAMVLAKRHFPQQKTFCKDFSRNLLKNVRNTYTIEPERGKETTMEHGILYYFGIAFIATGLVQLAKAALIYLRER